MVVSPDIVVAAILIVAAFAYCFMYITLSTLGEVERRNNPQTETKNHEPDRNPNTRPE